MSAKRSKKLKKRAEKERRAEERRLARVHQALASVGLYEHYERLPLMVKALVLKDVLPTPEFDMGDTAQPFPEAEEIHQYFEKHLREPSEPSPSFPYAVSWFDVFGVFEGLEIFVKTLRELPADVRRQLQQLPNLAVLAEFERRYGELVGESLSKMRGTLLAQLHFECWRRSRPDDKLFWYEELDRSQSRGRLRIKLSCVRPEQRRVTVDGNPRSAYRCFEVRPLKAPRPLSLTGERLGRCGDTRLYPVYIQSHAAEQWWRRLDGELCLYGYLSLSLVSPDLHAGAGGAVLVAYRTEGVCLGHFVCRVVDGVVLLQTFLLPGMKGTPEAKCLYEKLRLLPADIRQNELDRLETYVYSDLAQDPKLAQVFEECGFKELLRVASEIGGENLERGTAQGIRRYIGMEPVPPSAAWGVHRAEQTSAGEVEVVVCRPGRTAGGGIIPVGTAREAGE